MGNREHSFEYEKRRLNSEKRIKESKRRSFMSIDMKRKTKQLQTYDDKLNAALVEVFDEDYFDFEFDRRAHSDSDLKEIDLENKAAV